MEHVMSRRTSLPVLVLMEVNNDENNNNNNNNNNYLLTYSYLLHEAESFLRS